MSSFIRGATPLLTHTFPETFDLTEVDALNVCLVQNGKIIVERNKQSVTIGEHSISYRLTQTETLSLEPNEVVETQVKFKVGSQVIPTDIVKLSVGEILNEEEM